MSVLDDLLLRMTCERIAAGIETLRDMGFSEEIVLEGLRRQVAAVYGQHHGEIRDGEVFSSRA